MSTTRSGFVRADGARLIDDQGPLLLRGVGLGNWLLPEGYMWRFGDGLASPRQIEARFASLVGAERAAEFWRRFQDRFVAEHDFALIAGQGFDHVRLPLNARVLQDEEGRFLEDGFALVDRAIAAGRRHGLRVLLDLHGAPGGQTGTNIDDSPRGMPELFMHAGYRDLTIALWEELARRYRDEETVLGYDLLNEPLPHEWQHRYGDDLVVLYRDLTDAIRAIDDRHLLMYEGSHWATNWEPLAERFDANQVLQFHRYWCPPDRTSIAPYLAARDALTTPIYMGEGGENTPAWVYAATRLYERHGIGWNFWPWKKLDTQTSPLSASAPEEWSLIAEPTADVEPHAAWRILAEYLDAVGAERCAVRTPVLDALFARPALILPGWAGARADERPIAETAAEPIPDAVWDRPSGADYAADEVAGSILDPGEVMRFAFAAEPSSWTVDADDPAALTVRWDGEALTLTASARIVVHTVTVRP
ncbi:cellulase family glycosylhydrolase [Microbacterium sp. LjRoot45]|uniref:glycoside hydrolase family 5 protein n=1 Tax=Microbacterium sp. LjRoot45 TaxID=3342329 RepID=UPI003ECE25A9